MRKHSGRPFNRGYHVAINIPPRHPAAAYGEVEWVICAEVGAYGDGRHLTVAQHTIVFVHRAAYIRLRVSSLG